MILISGASGSGKTTVAKELEKKCYIVVPTYTTRPKRHNDDFTKCISRKAFNKLCNNDKFITYHTFQSKMGDVSYGIPTKEYEKNTSNTILIVAYEYIDAITEFVNTNTHDKAFLVYIDVDEISILNKLNNDTSRGSSSNDLEDRLKRDRSKNELLCKSADFVINNYEYKLSPKKLADMINEEYCRFLFLGSDMYRGER